MKKCSIITLLFFTLTLTISINTLAANNQQINILSGTPDAETITFDIGDGSDGDLTVSSNATVAGGKNYNNLRITSSGYLTITGSGILRVKGTLQIEGTLKFADGADGIDGNPSDVGTGYGNPSGTTGQNGVVGDINANNIQIVGGKIVAGNGGQGGDAVYVNGQGYVAVYSTPGSGGISGDIKIHGNTINVNSTSSITCAPGANSGAGAWAKNEYGGYSQYGFDQNSGNLYIYGDTLQINCTITGQDGSIVNNAKTGSSITILGNNVSVSDIKSGNAIYHTNTSSGGSGGNITIKGNSFVLINNAKLTPGSGTRGEYGGPVFGGTLSIKTRTIVANGTSGQINGGNGDSSYSNPNWGNANLTLYGDSSLECTFFHAYINTSTQVRLKTNSKYNAPWSAGTLTINNLSVTTPSSSASVNASGLNTISLSDFYTKYGAQNFDFIIERYVSGVDSEYKQVDAFTKALSSSLEWIDWNTVAKKDISYRIGFRKSLGVAPVSKDFANKSGFIFIEPFVLTSRSEGGSGLKAVANNGSNPFKVIKGVPFVELIYGQTGSGTFESNSNIIIVTTEGDEYSIIEGVINNPSTTSSYHLGYYVLDTGLTKILFKVIPKPTLDDIATVTFN